MSQPPVTVGHTVRQFLRMLWDVWEQPLERTSAQARQLTDDLQRGREPLTRESATRRTALGVVLALGILGLLFASPLTAAAIVAHRVLARRWGPGLMPGSQRVRGTSRTVVLGAGFAWQFFLAAGALTAPDGPLIWALLLAASNTILLIVWIRSARPAWPNEASQWTNQ